MKIGIPIYDDVNLLDVAGPLEAFYWAGRRNDLRTALVSQNGRSVTSINGVRFDADCAFSEMPELDILWVPGGSVDTLERIMRDLDSPYLKYIQQVSKGAAWVCSVCEGAMLLARAGLPDGHDAATHWAFVGSLRRFPEITVPDGNPRFLVSGNRLTGGGISSGLDESLELIRLLFDEEEAMRVQVTTEYFPRPPVMGKLPAKAPECSMDWEQQLLGQRLMGWNDGT